MRQMPSVTDTTMPMLRASAADWKRSMRCLIRSLISDGLMDIRRILAKNSSGAAHRRAQSLDAAAQRAVDHEIPVAHDRAADQRLVDLRMQAYRAAQAPLERGLQFRRLLAGQLLGRDHFDVGNALGLRA